MHLAGHEARELSEDVLASRPGIDVIGGGEWGELVVLFAFALDAVTALELGDVGGAAGRKPAVRLPEHRSVNNRLIGARRRRLARAPPAFDPRGVDLRRDRQVTRAINLDADLLDHDGRE